MELDYLAPFLAQLGDPPTLTKMQASKLKSDCLADLKQRLIDKANLIQVGSICVCKLTTSSKKFFLLSITMSLFI